MNASAQPPATLAKRTQLTPPGPLDPAVLREAARWLVRLHSGEAGPGDHAACARWREADAAHEQAWQRAQRLSQKFGAVPPTVGMPVLARQGRANRRAALRTLALFAAAVPAGYLGWRHMPWQAGSSDARTATGERRELQLADGSRVLLDTASAVDIRFDERQRTVRLRAGAIAVVTAPDPLGSGRARPFVVETAQGRLRALGTRFTVRQEGEAQDGGAVRVAVTEGAVEVTLRNATAPALVLPAGQQTVLGDAGAAPPEPVSTQSQAWTRGVLYADNMRLADFCAELARYRPGILHCAGEVAGLRISGAFQLRDTDYVLSMLATSLPVQVLTRTRYWVSVVPG